MTVGRLSPVPFLLKSVLIYLCIYLPFFFCMQFIVLSGKKLNIYKINTFVHHVISYILDISYDVLDDNEDLLHLLSAHLGLPSFLQEDPYSVHSCSSQFTEKELFTKCRSKRFSLRHIS